MVECFLCKEEVGGSNPPWSTKFSKGDHTNLKDSGSIYPDPDTPAPREYDIATRSDPNRKVKKKTNVLDWIFRISFWIFVVCLLPFLIEIVLGYWHIYYWDIFGELVWGQLLLIPGLLVYIPITIICGLIINKNDLNFVAKRSIVALALFLLSSLILIRSYNVEAIWGIYSEPNYVLIITIFILMILSVIFSKYYKILFILAVGIFIFTGTIFAIANNKLEKEHEEKEDLLLNFYKWEMGQSDDCNSPTPNVFIYTPLGNHQFKVKRCALDKIVDKKSTYIEVATAAFNDQNYLLNNNMDDPNQSSEYFKNKSYKVLIEGDKHSLIECLSTPEECISLEQTLYSKGYSFSDLEDR